MKFIHYLFINAIVCLNLIIAYEFIIVGPRITQVHTFANDEALNTIKLDARLKELEKALDELKNKSTKTN